MRLRGTNCFRIWKFALDPGSSEARFARWVASADLDPRGLLWLMGSLVPTPEDDLRQIATPTLVVIGEDDERSDADELAALLPHGRYVQLPRSHESAIATPAFAAALSEFLAGG